ncbi:MAG TPA: phosphoglycerate kinase, partial [Armatimonadota bacterium]|nr:phosphoglycerate kinase [Armatimonadota bacterium]
MDKLTVSSDAFPIEGKRVLLRADFNVPLKDGVITDGTRIKRTLDTINYILGKGGSVVAFSHLGRPKGVEAKYSMEPVAARLSELLGKPVKFVPTVTGPEAKVAADALQPGEVMLLENTRFEAGETKNDPAIAKALATLGDCFVNDAFGSSHRAHASTVGVAELARPAAAGLLVEGELKALQQLLEAPQKGFVVILGGAKVADKIDVIDSLLPKCEHMLVCGGMTYAFLSAQGKPIGNSIWWQESEDAARKILDTMGDALDRL